MSEKKKIAFFIDNISWGGAEKSLLALLNHLDYNNLLVDLYTMNLNGDDRDALNLLPRDVRHFSLQVSDNWFKVRICKWLYSFKIRVLPRLGIKQHFAELFWNTMKSTYPTLEIKYDAAIAYQQGMMTYYVADKVYAKKKIAWINSLLSAHKYTVGFNRKYYDIYDCVVAVCNELRRILCDIGYVNPSFATTIYDIIDERKVKEMAFEEIGYHSSHLLTFVTVARLSPEKNLLLAVETARLLKSKGVEFTWLIVGEGPSETSIREKISKYDLTDCVILKGVQSNPYKYMKMADVYVQTSITEGFGMAIAEAKILGCPVVTTNFPTACDQIKDGVNGLVSDMTAEDMCEKIIRLISDERLRKSIVENLSEERNLTSVTEPRKFLKLIFDRD